VVVIII